MAAGILTSRWRPVFRHSAGKLGSRYLSALRSEKRLLAWRTGEPPRALIPPKDLGGPGEWIEVGPEATLLSFAPAEWLPDSVLHSADGCVVARVRVDGADTPMLAAVAANGVRLQRGARLLARFADSQDDALPMWFEAIRATM